MTLEGCLKNELGLSSGLAIFGAGGFGREVAWLAQQCFGEAITLTFLVNRPALVGSRVNGIPVRDVNEFAERSGGTPVVIAIGDPRGREACAYICSAAGMTFATLAHPRIEASSWISLGQGSIICAGTILTTNIRLGDHVHVNLGCTIGHDVEMGDFATLAPGVHVSGQVRLGRRVYIGTGAVLINGTEGKPLVVGDDAVVGAGACVTRDVEAGSLVVGVPAKQKK